MAIFEHSERALKLARIAEEERKRVAGLDAKVAQLEEHNAMIARQMAVKVAQVAQLRQERDAIMDEVTQLLTAPLGTYQYSDASKQLWERIDAQGRRVPGSDG